jgi:hypothetical protein|eukprot:6969515-Prymnesium_polylepis.3
MDSLSGSKISIFPYGTLTHGTPTPELLRRRHFHAIQKGDREDPRNYRPITLLNTDYKIFTRILSKRMITVVHEIVSETQKGFVPDVLIADASMLLRLIEANINEEPEDRQGIFLFLDMEKAFDRVSYEFTKRGLVQLKHNKFFGRNLIVQGCFFGRLRYWLDSIHMNPKLCEVVQRDADILWWSRDPTLEISEDAEGYATKNTKRIKRWMDKRTAIGPTDKG